MSVSDDSLLACITYIALVLDRGSNKTSTGELSETDCVEPDSSDPSRKKTYES
jgi:hypothetical protein